MKKERGLVQAFQTKIKDLLRRFFRGFLVLPAILASSGVLLSFLTVFLDRSFGGDALLETFPFLNISVDGARAVLSTIAGAMITVISLVYSLTLIVFTLAAGNIGPRLLESFANNRINQVTVGLLGATFLFSLLVLYIAGDDDVPRISVLISILLSAFSFFWVVYFVHDTAERIMVDNEIGRSQRALRHVIDKLLSEETAHGENDRSMIPKRAATAIGSPRSGYVTDVDREGLVAIAEQYDVFIEIVAGPGSFVINGGPLARIYGNEENFPEKQVQRAVTFSDVRKPEGDIEFNIHLNVEIALRALSPGVNDAYTAISAIDHMSASLTRILQKGTPSSLVRDAEDTPRLWVELLEIKEIVGAALHPLCRAATANLLVTFRLIKALDRMAERAEKENHPILREHLLFIIEDLKLRRLTRSDRAALAQSIWNVHRTMVSSATK